ncbi:(deoxy)nucleoside triphosphate pyrophosphohydrolase [uncultured Friedmanniella sp.]|uniref:(deoxy)nucleoside triphosphate pyrophosphohydrolase n=1 Tax=uncultured Friedmanniella sp. TaxID=335381 RepID=UPI0035CC375A
MQLVVGAVIVDRLDAPSRVLAARRTRPPALAGRWELPGGKVEPGEQPLDALHRELSEELGVRVRSGDELVPGTGTTWPLTPGLELRAWWCEVTAGELRLSDAHDEFRWLAAEDLLDVPWLAPDRPLLDRVRPLLLPR